MNPLPSEAEVPAKAKQIYGEIQHAFGMAPNFFKAQAAVSADWLELNWHREKQIMLTPGALDRKTKELIALTVSLVNRCQYCSLAHEAATLMAGATEQEFNEMKQVLELFASFNAIVEMDKTRRPRCAHHNGATRRRKAVAG